MRQDSMYAINISICTRPLPEPLVIRMCHDIVMPSIGS